MEKRKRKNHGQTSALVWRVFRSGDVCVPGHAKLWISFPPFFSLRLFIFFLPAQLYSNDVAVAVINKIL
jgi:hypothetical protein